MMQIRHMREDENKLMSHQQMTCCEKKNITWQNIYEWTRGKEYDVRYNWHLYTKLPRGIDVWIMMGSDYKDNLMW